MRIAVIGGGASGIMAAIAGAYNGAYVTIYERCDRIGRKILATGNGRCNYTNINAEIVNYHGENPCFIKNITEKFWVRETIEFFESLGMLTKVENEGKAYPYSLQASAVLDVLRFELERLNIRIVTDFEVKSVKKQSGEFLIESYDGRREKAQKVILSTGGKASPSLGSNGSGYDIAKSLGHKITKIFPSLVQVKTETTLVKAMKGIKTDAVVSFLSGNVKDKVRGEVLFTEYGLSGPAVFNISRHCGETRDAKIKLDLLPDMDFNSLREMLLKRKELNITLENFFVGMLNKKIGMTVMKYANVLPYSRQADSLTAKEISSLCEAIKSFTLTVEGTMSWNNAQVTSGGVDVFEIDENTLESKIIKGLYMTGELLDIDGDCGGYNLQWAWSSGYVAGECAAKGE